MFYGIMENRLQKLIGNHTDGGMHMQLLNSLI